MGLLQKFATYLQMLQCEHKMELVGCVKSWGNVTTWVYHCGKCGYHYKIKARGD